ncbi:hypothetical protein [Phocaeicola vulgatus]|uniref:hypothetical protein n=1 Tax=Phocaeicola vulgatus TaxID=821 RepID=UPI00216B29F1|nr:hypothetical protein [Phocaeicola vulgatus]
MILYVYWGGSTGLFFINSKTGNSYIIRKVNGSMISEIEFKRKNDHLFVRSKTNTASFRVSALFLDTTGVDLPLSMNIVDENLDDAEDIEILEFFGNMRSGRVWTGTHPFYLIKI